jgi:hypothetical protein
MVLPPEIKQGKIFNGTLGEFLSKYKDFKEEGPLVEADRYVMGFPIPPWQRPIVWTEAQQVSFIENVLIGVPTGTIAVVDFGYENGSLIFGSDWLLDGQQRLMAIQNYVDGVFMAHGIYYADLERTDHSLRFRGRAFPSLVLSHMPEDDLKQFYNTYNFGGVAHSEADRA